MLLLLEYEESIFKGINSQISLWAANRSRQLTPAE